MKRILNVLLNRLACVAPGGLSVRPRLQRWRGVRIGKNVWFGLFVFVDEAHPEALTIGDNCTIGIRTSILTHFYWGPRRPVSNGTVVIEDDVFIGPHCLILPNVRIGRGSVIHAGTVVTQNVPPGTFLAMPAAQARGRVTVPLTFEHGHEAFLRGMKPIGRSGDRGGE